MKPGQEVPDGVPVYPEDMSSERAYSVSRLASVIWTTVEPEPQLVSTENPVTVTVFI